MSTPYQLVSHDAQIALVDFSTEFAMALSSGPPEPWALELGLTIASNALKTTWPIPLSTAGFHEFKGNIKYRDLFEKSINLTKKIFTDGVKVDPEVIEAPDFVGWAEEPSNIARASMHLAPGLLATLLEANGACEYDGLAYFHASHLCNPLDGSVGTFANIFTGSGTTLTAANVEAADVYFSSILGPDGINAGYRLVGLLVPNALGNTAEKIFEQRLVVASGSVGAVDNWLFGKGKVWRSSRFTSSTAWYAIGTNGMGAKPWVVQDGSMEERIHDKSSAMYEQELKVGMSYLKGAAAGLAIPHCCQSWAGTT